MHKRGQNMDSKTYTNNEFVKITERLIKIDDENKNRISNRNLCTTEQIINIVF